MRKIAFTKMEGCGNDYVYLDGFSKDLRLTEADIPALARAISDRHYGVGSDGLVLILPPASPDRADIRMRMFNADGSEAEMCGNASRCVGRFAWEHALTGRPVIRLETLAGIKLLQRVDDDGGCPPVSVWTWARRNWPGSASPSAPTRRRIPKVRASGSPCGCWIVNGP